MKPTATLACLSASLALAQSNFPDQSASFGLVLRSSDTAYNNTYLGSCHVGAGLESLCTAGADLDPHDVYRLNTSSTDPSTYDASQGMPGLLTWDLVAGGSNINETMVISQGLSLLVYESSNTALPIFGIGEQQFLVAFDEQGFMNVQSYYDDTVTPPTDYASTKAYYRWYICQNNFDGYEYFNLNWVLGDAKPQNPTCEKVQVLRTFV
ncbi:hypothetical protein Tdes44962_MAKER05877 [Teratosphaeria destructans]|uniref:DUF7907 domain-containing protein n=1 Tax=Teratosphaeria destructans TaxID=418781 RepID=A0A9W7SIZ6_9PEZI|nr:hypothetical protein Tdes44962_MAKER05877 [Teratosphaeria destructans]